MFCLFTCCLLFFSSRLIRVVISFRVVRVVCFSSRLSCCLFFSYCLICCASRYFRLVCFVSVYLCACSSCVILVLVIIDFVSSRSCLPFLVSSFSCRYMPSRYSSRALLAVICRFVIRFVICSSVLIRPVLCVLFLFVSCHFVSLCARPFHRFVFFVSSFARPFLFVLIFRLVSCLLCIV